MNLYRIILNDNLGLRRDRDETFATLNEANEFVNTLPQNGTMCLYQIRSNTTTPDKRFVAVERYVVWNN
jgi:hypothetical protein